ncbi:MAG TPA: prolipoprotein diacylglyceryl transferase family protein [Thermoleophilaceae bacterium]
MQPQIHLGPLELKTFGICFALGFLAAGALLARRLRELGEPVDWAYEVVFAALVGGVVGSRVDYLIQNWDKVKDDLLGNLFSGSGLVWYGGVVGGAIGVLLWAKRRDWLSLTMLDVVSLPLALGYAIGRIGCQLSGDGDYGIHSSLPWAMSYPHGTVPTTQEVHPTPVYETLAMGFVTLLLWQWRDRFRPGGLFGVYLVLAGLERLLVEFIRRNDSVIAGLTLPQLLSLAMIAGGVALLASVGREPRTA